MRSLSDFVRMAMPWLLPDDGPIGVDVQRFVFDLYVRPETGRSAAQVCLIMGIDRSTSGLTSAWDFSVHEVQRDDT